MERQGEPEDWDYFHLLLGRYVSAAGHAEWAMWVLLRSLQHLVGLPVTDAQPPWAGLVAALRALPDTPFTARVDEVLQGAERRGRLRNNRVHTSYWSVGPDGHASRRAYAKRANRR